MVPQFPADRDCGRASSSAHHTRGIGHQLVQHNRNRLGGFWRQQHLGTALRLRCPLPRRAPARVNEVAKAHALPVAAAEQCLCICHRLNAAIKHLEKLVHRGHCPPGALRNRGDRASAFLTRWSSSRISSALPLLRRLRSGCPGPAPRVDTGRLHRTRPCPLFEPHPPAPFGCNRKEADRTGSRDGGRRPARRSWRGSAGCTRARNSLRRRSGPACSSNPRICGAFSLRCDRPVRGSHVKATT